MNSTILASSALASLALGVQLGASAGLTFYGKYGGSSDRAAGTALNFDENMDGYLTYDEGIKFFADLDQQKDAEEFGERFVRWDTNRDGILSKDELEHGFWAHIE